MGTLAAEWLMNLLNRSVNHKGKRIHLLVSNIGFFNQEMQRNDAKLKTAYQVQIKWLEVNL